MEEHFTKYGDTASAGYLTGIDWDRQLEVLKQTQAAGKYLLGVSHSDRDRLDRGPLRLGHDAARRDGQGVLQPRRELHRRDVVPRVRL